MVCPSTSRSPLRSARPDTTTELRVPSEVMLVCAEVRTDPLRLPVTLPVTSPVRGAVTLAN